jgi:hypothetical protein
MMRGSQIHRHSFVTTAPKGQQAVAWGRKPQVRAEPEHSRSANVLFSQAPEWGRHGRALKQLFEKQRAVVSGFAAVSLLRSLVLKKSKGFCGPRPRTWGLRRQATTCRRIRGSNPPSRRCADSLAALAPRRAQ